MNAVKEDNSESSNKIVERIQIEGTPVWIIGGEKGYFAAIGDKRITEMNTKETIETEVYGLSWPILINAMICIYNGMKEKEENASANNKR